MWPIIGSLAVCIVVFIVEFPSLRKLKQYKEMTLFISLIAVSLTIYTMQTLHVPIPNPLDFISMIIEAFGLAIG